MNVLLVEDEPRVADFIDTMLMDGHPPAERDRFIAGLEELDRRATGGSFSGAPAAHRIAVLAALGFAHTGTHADAPVHFVPGGETFGELSLEPWVGPCRVVCHASSHSERYRSITSIGRFVPL